MSVASGIQSLSELLRHDAVLWRWLLWRAGLLWHSSLLRLA